jgi:RNA polymerase sigma factor (sigma-70 family)
MRVHDPAFDQVFMRCFPRALRLAGRVVGDHSTAEDIASDTMAATWSRWSSVRELPHLDAWVLRVATNKALDAMRRRKRGEAVAAERLPQDEIEVFALREAIRALPRRQQEAIVLCQLAGFTESEVGDLLGISPNTVATHVRRAREGLRAQLADEQKKESPSWTS